MATFTIESKIRTVQEYFMGHESIKEVAKRHSLNHQGLHLWIKLCRHYGEEGLRKRSTNYIVDTK